VKDKVDVNPDNAKFIELRTTNYKKVKAFRVRPDGAGVIKIIGDNDQGKTSAIESLAAVLGGPDFTPKNPIRKGQNEAEVFADLGVLRATRTWKRREDKTIAMTLAVEFADGSKPSKKQSVLDELRGTDLAADPLEFAYMPAKAQFDILKALVPGIDFDDVARRRKELFDDRTQAGRDRDREKGAADAIVVPQGTPLQLVESTALVAQISAGANMNTAIDRERERRAAVEASAEAKLNEADELMIRARTLEAEAKRLRDSLASLPPLGTPVDLSELEERIANADATNENVRLLQRQDAHRAAAKDASRIYDDLTRQIEELDAAKNKAIEQAKLPVKGMSFGDDEILMNGEPFTEASQAQKIMVSMAVAMALKPKLRVISIKDGSLLDAKSMKIVAEMAVKNDFVVLLERVAVDGERDGIIIENGEMV
jgi:hypothetical protein